MSASPVAHAKAWRALVKILLPTFDIASGSSSIGGNHVCEDSPQLVLFCLGQNKQIWILQGAGWTGRREAAGRFLCYDIGWGGGGVGGVWARSRWGTPQRPGAGTAAGP